MSAVTNNSHSVVVPDEQEVYALVQGPSPFPGFVFCEARECEDGWRVIFVRKEAMENSFRNFLKSTAN